MKERLINKELFLDLLYTELFHEYKIKFIKKLNKEDFIAVAEAQRIFKEQYCDEIFSFYNHTEGCKYIMISEVQIKFIDEFNEHLVNVIKKFIKII